MTFSTLMVHLDLEQQNDARLQIAGYLKLDNVLVAWKDTREARRAVVDAVPLLHKAKDTSVLEIVESEASRGAAQGRVTMSLHGSNATTFWPRARRSRSIASGRPRRILSLPAPKGTRACVNRCSAV
jgi:hypothetical protein